MNEYIISVDIENRKLSIIGRAWGEAWHTYRIPTDKMIAALDAYGMCYFSQDGILVYRVNLDGYLLALEATKEV